MSGLRTCLVAGLFAGLAFAWTPTADGQEGAERPTAGAPQERARRGGPPPGSQGSQEGTRRPGQRGGAVPRGEGEGQRENRAARAPAAQPSLPESWVESLKWRSLGPANMSGRITALAVCESDPRMWWAATASGGLLKTVNGGMTFEHQFDREATVSIGDVQVAPSDPNIVWVGTGESNPRNSVSWGNGVYKSIDGGKTWKHMGLEKTFQIGRMAIHPENPDIVYVGALGRLWGENEERGLFKTVDGGETWEKVLYVDERTGVVDVNLMPGQPDTLLVATYERQRDRYDTNDPEKKWGPGSGIWKSTDAGATFHELEQGLPSVDLGRIDVEYFRGDPGTILALVESSRIGEEPEDAAWLGVEGQDADVGARLTSITEGGPAEKAGLAVGDIVIEIAGETVHSYSDMIAKVRRHLAGETVAIEVSRERKSVSSDVAFERRPETEEDRPGGQGGNTERRGRRRDAEAAAEAEPASEKVAAEEASAPSEAAEATEAETEVAAQEGEGEPEAKVGGEAVAEEAGEPEAKVEGEAVAEEAGEPESESEADEAREPRAPFRTGLGGQVANVQDQQGPEGHEYGGLFKSTDGGETWTRINSINPRPMYFSQLRVDPSDANFVYVLGIRLHRSTDGGETFDDDGGGRSVHVDHHAMWIDPRDGRHILLGNDGGLYSTHDRMENWDHFNHVAIGQFYHVAVDTRANYRVYGGLQDNGTWGGPNRVRNGSGARNEDWLSIGGGDGFICRIDPNDPDLVYFESQNGGMGRRNLRTGERGFLRPRAERGTRYRFNWRTPFILSHHNSGIYYTAGNHVFRSWLQGDELKAISPEITSTDKGSATALAESPFDAAVLYVGSDDGALWRTLDGGHSWTNLFEPKANPARPAGGVAVAASAPTGGNGNGQEPEAPSNPISGMWTLGETPGGGGGPGGGGQRSGRRGPGGGGGGGGPGGGMSFELKLDEAGALTGSLETGRGTNEVSSGSYDPETRALEATFGEGGFPIKIKATLDEAGAMKGTLDFAGRFQREFEATRGAGDGPVARNDGHDWKTIAELVPEPLYVSSIEPSGFEAERVYLSLDGHRSDDLAPHVFVSEDQGATWRSLAAGLPTSCGSVRILREDIESENVLYLGAEFGAWVSIDRGATWTRLNSNLPTVAVHELAQHPTAGEIVAATHGRSLWALDVTPLRQMSKEKVEAPATLYRPNVATYWRSEPSTGGTIRRFEADNPSDGVEVFYSLGEATRRATLRIKDLSGETLANLETSGEVGLHRATWNLRPQTDDAAGGGGGGGGGGRFRRGAPRVQPGTYLVELKIGSLTLTEPLVVLADPEFPETVLWGEEYERQMEIEELLRAKEEYEEHEDVGSDI